MATRSFDRVETWESRPVAGLDALRDLAAEGFSGAASADGTWVFFLNGRVVGVFDGELEAFRSAQGTAYAAPDPALALLTAMQERGGETQARYYTNDTPLPEVADTLSEANFTGYVELSENVLSGDYYLVYHGGERMAVAVVGNREEVVAGSEAYELAADEVGIYEVVSVDVQVTELPEPAGDTDGETAAGGVAGGTVAGAGATEPDSGDDDRATDETPPVDEAEPAKRTDDAEPTGTDEGDAERAPPGDGPSPAGGGLDDDPLATGEEPTAEPAGLDPTDAGEEDGDQADAGEGVADPRTGGEAAEESADAAAGADDGDRFSQEESWRDTVTVPAVAPDESGTADGGSPANGGSSGAAVSSPDPAPEPDRDREEGGGRRRELRSELEAARERLAELEAERDSLAEERDDLRQERDRLRERTEELRSEVAELRAELSSAREQASDAGATPTDEEQSDPGPTRGDPAAGTEPDGATVDGPSGPGSLSPAEALAGTDLFVRYGSRGEDTLEDVSEGATPESLRGNLRLDHHTQFDDDGATVAGEPFEAFLEDTAEYGFVTWLVEELPFEIRETGHEGELSDLYEALPEVDRAELDGTVSVETADGETVTRSFDVVVRDRMGNALVVADLNDRRAPVTAAMMDDLVSAATDVGGTAELAGAVYVTASFFEPDALESAASATADGFLRRDRRESYVKTGRKTGFHLCLVESRGGDFYLTVPEL